jgi:hypothetical protein
MSIGDEAYLWYSRMRQLNIVLGTQPVRQRTNKTMGWHPLDLLRFLELPPHDSLKLT